MRGDRFNNGINFGSLRDCYTGERRIHKRRHVRALRKNNDRVINDEIKAASEREAMVIYLGLHESPLLWRKSNTPTLGDLIARKVARLGL